MYILSDPAAQVASQRYHSRLSFTADQVWRGADDISSASMQPGKYDSPLTAPEIDLHSRPASLERTDRTKFKSSQCICYVTLAAYLESRLKALAYPSGSAVPLRMTSSALLPRLMPVSRKYVSNSMFSASHRNTARARSISSRHGSTKYSTRSSGSFRK